jgi:hypothetical protein
MLVKDGGEIAVLSEESLQKLNELLPGIWSKNNPLDVLGDASAEHAKSVGGRDRNRVQITKSHRPGWSRMMAWRTNQSKSFSAGERQVNRTDCGSSSASGMCFDFRVIRSVRIKIDGLAKTFQMFRVMNPQNVLRTGQMWFIQTHSGRAPEGKPPC